MCVREIAIVCGCEREGKQTAGYLWPKFKFNNVFIDLEGRVRLRDWLVS